MDHTSDHDPKNLDAFLLQNKSELIKDMADSPCSPEVDGKGNNCTKHKKSRYLKELNRAADWNEEHEFSFIHNDPQQISEILKKIKTVGPTFSDNLLEYFNQTFLESAKKAKYATLLATAIESCSDTAREQVFKSVANDWLTFCTNKNTTKVAQSLVVSCSEFLVDDLFYLTLETIFDQVKDLYGFYCTFKLIKRLKTFQKEEIFKQLLHKPFFWKTKNCFLTLGAIINDGVNTSLMTEFLDISLQNYKSKNRNVSRLKKMISKKMQELKKEKN